MYDRGETKFGTMGFTVGPEETAGELQAVVSDDAVGYPKTADVPLMNLTAALAGMVRTASTSIHLVNFSTATKRKR